MCASRSVKGSAPSSRTSASTPMQRPARERSEQHSTRCGSASGLPGASVSFMHQRLALRSAPWTAGAGARASGTGCRGRLAAAARTSVMFFSGTSSAAGAGAQVLDGLLQQQLQLVGAVGVDGLGGRPCASSRFRSLSSPPTVRCSSSMVARATRSRRRHSSAGREERVGEGEIVVAAVIARAAHHREQRQQLLLVVAQRSTGTPAGCRRAAGAARGSAGWTTTLSSASSTILMRSGPVMVSVDHMQLARGPEHGDAGGARQQRAQQPHVGLETRAGLAGDVLAVGTRLHWRNRR